MESEKMKKTAVALVPERLFKVQLSSFDVLFSFPVINIG